MTCPPKHLFLEISLSDILREKKRKRKKETPQLYKAVVQTMSVCPDLFFPHWQFMLRIFLYAFGSRLCWQNNREYFDFHDKRGSSGKREYQKVDSFLVPLRLFQFIVRRPWIMTFADLYLRKTKSFWLHIMYITTKVGTRQASLILKLTYTASLYKLFIND